jgi:hypothetical protein
MYVETQIFFFLTLNDKCVTALEFNSVQNYLPECRLPQAHNITYICRQHWHSLWFHSVIWVCHLWHVVFLVPHLPYSPSLAHVLCSTLLSHS